MKTNINLDKDLFTIGEVADILGVDQHVVRFWTAQFANYVNPIRKAGLRRYYSKEDIKYLTNIKEELYNKGLSIRGLQLKLENKDNDGQNKQSSEKAKENQLLINDIINNLNLQINNIENCLESKK